jgi:hypothetical protein
MARTVTARSLIVGTFRLLGITAQGETPNANELLEAFDRLNEMVDGWSTQRLTMRVVTREQYALVSGQASYTIGPAGTTPTPDWIGARPEFVDSVALVLSSSTPEVEIPLGAMTEQAYQALTIKTMENSLPTLWYYDATMPSGTFTVWPVPNTADNPVVVYAPQATAQFPALATEVVLPPGYTDALRYNLAVRLAPEYGRQLSPEIALLAADTLGNIKRLNVGMVDLGFDPGLLPVSGRYGYNILTDCG